MSCSKEEEHKITIDTGNKNANIIGTDASVSGIEIPHLNSKYDYICHKLSNGLVNYTIEYDKKNYHSRWVAYTYDSKNAQRNWTTRTDAWAGEPYYDSQKDYQIAGILSNGKSQTFPGYNRGHLVGSAERYYSQEANEQTFYMSNMSPMNGNFNSKYWGEIEDKVRDEWGRNVINKGSEFYGGTLYVVKGGALEKTEANPNPIMTYCQVLNSKGDYVKMAVPRYYFLACLFINPIGSAKAIGFWIEHKDYNNMTEPFLTNLRHSSACSIDELEKRTGIDFFCNLNDGIEEALEKTYNISQWSGL